MNRETKADFGKSKTSCELEVFERVKPYSTPYVQLVKKMQSIGPLNIPDLNEFLVKAKIDFLNLYNNNSVSDFKITDFKLIKVLGFGGFGKVILAELKKDKTIYAIKAINKRFVMESNCFFSVYNEKRILQSIHFPFVVYLKHFFVDFNYLYYAMPFVPNGDFEELLLKHQRLNESHARFYMSQLVLALEYLHYLDLIHRDLKPKNIMIDTFGYIKVCDFGLCIMCTGYERAWSMLGTPDYMAPEMITGNGYDCAVDWWAFGVILYETCAGKRPFRHSNTSKLYEIILETKYDLPNFLSKRVTNLIKNLLNSAPSKRIGGTKKGVKNVKSHSWFKTTDWYKILNRTLEAPVVP